MIDYKYFEYFRLTDLINLDVSYFVSCVKDYISIITLFLKLLKKFKIVVTMVALLSTFVDMYINV